MSLRLSLPFLLLTLFSVTANAQRDPSHRIDKRTGVSHDEYYKLGPDSLVMEGVPQGQLSEAKVIQSNVFPGHQHTYWVYVPAQYDPTKPTALMVFNDGAAMKAEYNISDNPDHHGIMGSSSGGCAAFGVAWFRPDHFRKAITFSAALVDLRGEHIYPELVMASEKKPIRIFMQDGRNDYRLAKEGPYNPKMDFFYQNVRLKDALETKGYDINYSWGISNHGQKHGGSIFPSMMRWLWRYQHVSTDPYDKLEQTFYPAVSK